MAEVKEAPKAKTENGPAQAKTVAARPQTPTARPSASPFTFMRRFAEEMDQLFEDFGLESRLHLPRLLTRGHELVKREAGIMPAEWSPQVDVLEREGLFVVRADLPGLGKDDIKVEVTDDLLTIQGERRQEKKEEREGRYYSECSYGKFYRAIPIPEGVEASKATAEFRKGVLEITMPAPKRAEPKPRAVEIHEAK